MSRRIPEKPLPIGKEWLVPVPHFKKLKPWPEWLNGVLERIAALIATPDIMKLFNETVRAWSARTADAYIHGQVAEGLDYAWAGAMFFAGRYPMGPTDLSSKPVLVFWAKGEGRKYNVMLFAESLGGNPADQSFTAGPEWKRYVMPISSFQGLDGRDISGVLFGAGPEPGKFALQIDNVRFEAPEGKEAAAIRRK